MNSAPIESGHPYQLFDPNSHNCLFREDPKCNYRLFTWEKNEKLCAKFPTAEEFERYLLEDEYKLDCVAKEEQKLSSTEKDNV